MTVSSNVSSLDTGDTLGHVSIKRPVTTMCISLVTHHHMSSQQNDVRSLLSNVEQELFTYRKYSTDKMAVYSNQSCHFYRVKSKQYCL